MKRVLGPVMAGVIAVAAAGAVVSACAHNDSSIFVFNAIDPGTTTPGTQCAVLAASPTTPQISNGTLDVELSTAYTVELLVGNQLVAQADPTIPRTETSFFDVQGAKVRITDADGNPIANYTNLAATTIPPSVGGIPGYAIVSLEIVNEAAVAAAAVAPGNDVTLITYTTVFGKSLGGQYIESNEFEFPVTLCAGCLIQFSSSDINPACMPQPNCVGTGASSTMVVPCIPGEGPTDCSLCLDNRFCNPPVVCGIDAGLTD